MSQEPTYDDNIKIWRDAYQSILEVCEKYPEFDNKFGFRDIDDMWMAAKNHLLLIEWYEKYGLKVDHDSRPYSRGFCSAGEYRTFSKFGDAVADKDAGSGKFISWPDDGRQPKNEWLFIVCFPTGAYIFGKDYDGQRQFFQDFFDELKSYKPDYSDSHNNCLYWKLENARSIYKAFYSILQKYQERNKAEHNQREAARLRKRLAELDAS